MKQAVFIADAQETPWLWLLKIAGVLLFAVSPKVFEALTSADLRPVYEWAPIGFYVLVVAPYIAWRGQYNAANALRMQLQPAISLSATTASAGGGATAHKRLGQVCVRNEGTEPLLNCTGRITDFRAADSRKTIGHFTPMSVRWALSDGAGQHRTIHREGFLDVCQIEKAYTGRISVVGPFDERGRHIQQWFAEGSYVVSVEVGADNSATVTRQFSLSIDPLNQFAPDDMHGGKADAPLPNILFRLIE